MFRKKFLNIVLKKLLEYKALTNKKNLFTATVLLFHGAFSPVLLGDTDALEKNKWLLKQQQRYEQVNKQEGSILGEMQNIDQSIHQFTGNLEQLEVRKSYRLKEQMKLEGELSKLEKDILNRKSELEKRLRAIYKYSGRGAMQAIMAGGTAGDISKRISYLKKIIDHDFFLIESQKDMINKMNSIKKQLEKEHTDSLETEDKIKIQLVSLNNTRNKKELLLKRVRREKNIASQMVVELEESANILSEKIDLLPMNTKLQAQDSDIKHKNMPTYISTNVAPNDNIFYDAPSNNENNSGSKELPDGIRLVDVIPSSSAVSKNMAESYTVATKNVSPTNSNSLGIPAIQHEGFRLEGSNNAPTNSKVQSKNLLADKDSKIVLDKTVAINQPASSNNSFEKPNENNKEEKIEQKKASTKSISAFFAQRGLLPFPLSNGKITKSFGKFKESGMKVYDFHRGIDIVASAGTEFRAIYNGEVKMAEWFKGYGLLMIIDHGDGYHSVYAHAAKFFQIPGDHVKTGEKIGIVGDTGSFQGAYLYMEIREHGKPINPLDWLNVPISALPSRINE